MGTGLHAVDYVVFAASVIISVGIGGWYARPSAGQQTAGQLRNLLCFVMISISWNKCSNVNRCGSRIWSRGAPGSEAESCRRSKASNLQPGSRALEAFGFLMLKYAFSHILETLFL